MGLRADKACIDRCAFVSYKSGYNFFIKEIGNS